MLRACVRVVVCELTCPILLVRVRLVCQMQLQIGAIVFFAIMGRAPVLVSGEDVVPLPPQIRIHHGDRLADFLEQLLLRDPASRLRCDEALATRCVRTW